MHGWALYFHPAIIAQLEKLTENARKERDARKGRGPAGKNEKLLAHLADLMFDKIPSNPGSPTYSQGGTLGPDLRHWRRGKTGNGRFRLFFRYQSSAKIIVFGWVNDEDSLRTYGASTDAYGNPPKDWDDLLAQAKAPEAQAHTADVLAQVRKGSD